MSALYAAEGPEMDEVRKWCFGFSETFPGFYISRFFGEKTLRHFQVRDALFENGADGFLKTSSLQYLPTWPKWVLEQRG